MAVQKIDKSQWRTFFDTISKEVAGMRAEIEVASLKLGAQIEAEWLPLIGITYDSRDDVLDVALGASGESLNHLIQHPREVYADSGVGGLISFEVIDGDGAKQIITLREPLSLPPPAATGA